MFAVRITERARDSLASIPKKHAAQIVEKIRSLAKNPDAFPVKSLRGYPGFFRVRSGEYRIIYSIRRDELILLVAFV